MIVLLDCEPEGKVPPVVEAHCLEEVKTGLRLGQAEYSHRLRAPWDFLGICEGLPCTHLQSHRQWGRTSFVLGPKCLRLDHRIVDQQGFPDFVVESSDLSFLADVFAVPVFGPGAEEKEALHR